MIKDVECFLHFFHPGCKQFPLLFQDVFPGFNRPVALLDQPDILDQHFDGKPGTTHTFNEIDPPNINFTVIPNTTFTPVYRRQETNTFIVTQRIRRKAKAFAYFRNFHNFTSKNSVSPGVDSKSSVFWRNIKQKSL